MPRQSAWATHSKWIYVRLSSWDNVIGIGSLQGTAYRAEHEMSGLHGFCLTKGRIHCPPSWRTWPRGSFRAYGGVNKMRCLSPLRQALFRLSSLAGSQKSWSLGQQEAFLLGFSALLTGPGFPFVASSMRLVTQPKLDVTSPAWWLGPPPHLWDHAPPEGPAQSKSRLGTS